MTSRHKVYRHASLICPWCGKKNDAATAIDGNNSPEEGDAAVCMNCAKVAIYTFAPHSTEPTLRKPNPEEERELAKSVLIARAKAAIIVASRHPETGWEMP